jgi:dTDP-4-dehydrorhamnose 3,5-epimerase
MMKFIESKIKGHYVIEVDQFRDTRGLFERIFCKQEFSAIGFHQEIVQINHSLSVKKGTVRGMHFQIPPFDEIKIIKCIKGSVYDIAIDLHKESSTFLKWQEVELTDENNKMVLIPAGFAHGFQTLRDNSELLYFHTGYYNPENERALNYMDPRLKLVFPLKISEISERDKCHPFINDPVNDIPFFHNIP